MDGVIIKGGRVFCPATGVDDTLDIIVMAGSIASMKPSVEAPDALWAGVDCTGMLVIPGLVDIHTHLREPGAEYKETIETGTRAAAAGGVTTVACMANTTPVNDNVSIASTIIKKSRQRGTVRVFPVAALSQGLLGKTLTEMAELKEAGCVAFSDDGVPVVDGQLMRRALEYSRNLGVPVITHAEDPSISGGGVMNEGPVATRLGLKGIPNQAEDSMVARDVGLAELTGGRLHVAHVSTRGSVDLIRAAKARGVAVTAEATPHHLTLTDEAVVGYDTDAKMSPPLRSAEDVSALIEGLKDGTIDAIATDHAPHSPMDKDVEFDAAACGIVGLETSLALVLGLVDKGLLTLKEAITAMTVNPARVLSLDAGTFDIGSPADIAVVDLERRWVVDPSKFQSKGRNTPFKGKRLKGLVVKTLIEGGVVYEAPAKPGSKKKKR